MNNRDALARLLTALRPWLGELVVVGGLCHELLRLHAMASVPAYTPVRTKDADFAFSLRATLDGDLKAALQRAGFSADYSGEYRPPIAQYRLGKEDEGFYAEFLVPLLGSEQKSDGSPDATILKSGITAQKLRHLEILLIQPWTVRVSAASGVPLAAPADVGLANPVSFIVQKLLIHGDRARDKKSQDALYVHDTLELFGAELEALRALWTDQVRPSMLQGTAASINSLIQEQYGSVNDVIRGAVRIPQDRTLRPEVFQATCGEGLRRLFAD